MQAGHAPATRAFAGHLSRRHACLATLHGSSTASHAARTARHSLPHPGSPTRCSAAFFAAFAYVRSSITVGLNHRRTESAQGKTLRPTSAPRSPVTSAFHGRCTCPGPPSTAAPRIDPARSRVNTHLCRDVAATLRPCTDTRSGHQRPAATARAAWH